MALPHRDKYPRTNINERERELEGRTWNDHISIVHANFKRVLRKLDYYNGK